MASNEATATTFMGESTRPQRNQSRIGLTSKLMQPTSQVSGKTEMERIFEFLSTTDSADGPDNIGQKGIQLLCEELGIRRDSMEMYTLIWKLGVTKSGCIPRYDWLGMVYNYNIESVYDLKLKLREWVKESTGPALTECCCELYDFIRGDNARLMLPETAARAWKTFFGCDPRVEEWIKWYTTVYREEVTRDIWNHVPVFFSNQENATPYRKEDKWPSAFDLFVEWRDTIPA
uniref:Defective in cullin neddylation protein n=1 Tax=Trypanosoma congolense (strain IL3000) TaxID=1068625 RepID=F9WAN2_TRYCI|nr:unnamed protein product [Trypanosoma congolense IL3000]